MCPSSFSLMVTSGGFAIFEMSTPRTSARMGPYCFCFPLLALKQSRLGGFMPAELSSSRGEELLGGACRRCCISKKIRALKVCQNSTQILKVSSFGPMVMRTRYLSAGIMYACCASITAMLCFRKDVSNRATWLLKTSQKTRWGPGSEAEASGVFSGNCWIFSTTPWKQRTSCGWYCCTPSCKHAISFRHFAHSILYSSGSQKWTKSV
mmetsp:Transcript_54151/g.116257  ORF Transcript_54151/g.116257 Transcript_54151/m.116257 type:complete len:208 (-) Transcript_54151:842-1465(-)